MLQFHTFKCPKCGVVVKEEYIDTNAPTNIFKTNCKNGHPLRLEFSSQGIRLHEALTDSELHRINKHHDEVPFLSELARIERHARMQ